MLLEALEERIGDIGGLKVGPSVFTRVGLLHLSAQRVADELSTIADAQHRQASYKLREVDLESLRIVHRKGRSGEDDADDRRVVDGKLVVGKNLAEGVKLTHTTADELCGL